MFFVEKPLYKDGKMSIKELQRDFAKEIARASNNDIRKAIDKLFSDKDINGLEKYIKDNKARWPADIVKYASNMLEDLVYALDSYRKYEMGGSYTKDEVEKLVYSKQQLVKQRNKTTNPKEIKELEDKIATIKKHLMKAKAENGQ